MKTKPPDMSNFLMHYFKLLGTVYPQPADPGHTEWAHNAVEHFEQYIDGGLAGLTVLDIGCGQGFMQDYFVGKGAKYLGITKGSDVDVALTNGRNVEDQDMNFLELPDDSVDFIFARHTLEHSPMPILTLMEWGRVIKPMGYMILVAPAPAFWGVAGRNHFSVVEISKLTYYLNVAGWGIIGQYDLYTTQEEFQKHNPEEIVNHSKEVEHRLLLRYTGEMEI